MNKKEVLEIRKIFSREDTCISRIAGCYVDYQKTKVCLTKDAFLNLEKDETLKYMALFKSTLTGTMGKNLLNMAFPTKEEMPGGKQELLMKLRETELKDDAILDEFYDKVIEQLDYAENYYIILIYGAYDVPGKTTDGLTMDDASDEVYPFILCSICPVNRAKGALGYLYEEKRIGQRLRDWLVEAPMLGFLFPSFNDRTADIHNCLYFSKNPENSHSEFADMVLGAEIPDTPKHQQTTFQSIIEQTLGDEVDYETVSSIHENLTEMIAESKDQPEPLSIGKQAMKNLLQVSGVKEPELEQFDKIYEDQAGSKTSFTASNLTNVKKLSIEAPDIVIKVNTDRTDLIKTQVIDGRECLVITVDDHVKINGMDVKTIGKK